MVLEVNDKKDLSVKIQEAGNKLVVIDFYAVWCGPCKIIAPKIEELEKQYPNVVFLKVDVDENEEIAADYDISAMPTFVFIKNGNKLDSFSGANFSKLQSTIDQKFSDIGNTACLQYNQIKQWADLVTVHSLPGEGILKALKSCTTGNAEKGCFLVAELSCEGHLMSKDYIQETLKIAKNNEDFVVGLVCQSPNLINSPHFIQLTPGVKIEKGSDNLGQYYNDPEYVVLEKGADIAVVGRGITLSSDYENAAILHKEKLWNAYQKRIA